MKDNITKNVTLSSSEQVIKHFKKLDAVNTYAQVMLTSKRLIIYTKARLLSKGKHVQQKMMNEIDLKSIHRFEYYIETHQNPLILRIIGLVIFLAVSYLVYLLYSAQFQIPAYPYQNMYTDYGICAVSMLIGLILTFSSKSILYLRIKSGLDEKTTLLLHTNKYNELACRFLAGKIHIN